MESSVNEQGSGSTLAFLSKMPTSSSLCFVFCFNVFSMLLRDSCMNLARDKSGVRT